LEPMFNSRTTLDHKGKIADRSRDGLLMGYSVENVCYRIWDVERKRMVLTRDCIFQ